MRVYAVSAGRRTLIGTRHIQSGAGYCRSSPLEAHVGLGTTPADDYRVEVYFPATDTTAVTDHVKPGQRIVLREGRDGFAEIIGRVREWRQSDTIRTPWNKNGDQGGYGRRLRGSDRRRNFTFLITAHRDALIHTLEVNDKDRKPFSITRGETYRIFNRPVTTWNFFQASFTVTDLQVNWRQEPTVRLIVAAEANHSSFRPERAKHPTALVAYLIQVRPQRADADLPPAHWPVWYVNNWIHFARHVMPTVHYRYMANHGFNFWSWGVFDLPVNLKEKPAIGVYRLLWHPEARTVSSVVLHTPGCCELTDATDERLRSSAPPVARARASADRGTAPLVVDFSARARDAEGNAILWYTWDFDAADGAGVDAVGPRARHTFRQPGTYMVSLSAMAATGLPGRDHLKIVVKEGS